MAVKLSTQRCSDCQGALEFNKVTKQFECPYCGKVYEKNYQFEKVQIDGMAGINDTVRATFIDLSKYDFTNAEKNLSNCERLNHNYVGTIIANIAYYLLKSIYVKDDSSKMCASKARMYIDELKRDYANVDDEEKSLYDFLDDAELYAILYIVYSFASLKERASYLANFLDIKAILNPTTNKSLLTIFLQSKALKEIDEVLANIDFIDKRYSLYQLLKYYEDNDKKREYIRKLFAAGAFSYKDSSLVNKYLQEINDSSYTKLIVLSLAYQAKIDVEISSILSKVFSETSNPQDLKEAFAILEAIRLPEEDAASILRYCLSGQCPNMEICELGLVCLKNSGNLFEMDAENMVYFLNNSRLTVEEKLQMIEKMFELFKMTHRSLDQLSTHILLDLNLPENERFEFIKYILSKVNSITLETLDNYVIGFTKDTKTKAKVVDIILNDLKMNKAYFNNLLSNYILHSHDDNACKNSVIELLLNYDCTMNNDAIKMLFGKMHASESLINLVLSKKINIAEDVLETYFNHLTDMNEYNSYLVNKLVGFRFKVSSATVVKFLLKVKEKEIVKSNIGCLMIDNVNNSFANSYNFMFQEDSILGNIAQYYLLVSDDASSDKLKIIKSLMKAKIKLSDTMVVNKKNIAFKKYIVSKKESLDLEIDNLCNELGVYKLFF